MGNEIFTKMALTESENKTRKLDYCDFDIEAWSKFADDTKALYEKSYRIYSTLVDRAIIKNEDNQKCLEHLFDSLLDFCDDQRFVELFKRLCRYVLNLYPDMVGDYIGIYKKQYEDEN